MELSSVISLAGTAIGILAIFIALFKQKGNFFKKYSFLLMLGCLTYYCLVVYIVDSGLILDYPHFFKTGSPFLYFLAISILWVGQAHLFGKEGFDKWDYALILLPVLNVIEFTPFYLKSYEEKRSYLSDLIADRDQFVYAYEGWVPTFIHYIVQVSMGLIVSVFLLSKVFQQNKVNELHRHGHSWLRILVLIFVVFYLIGLGLLIFDSENLPIHVLASWLFALMLLSQLFFLFFRPEVLYDIVPVRSAQKPSVNPTFSLVEKEAESFRLNIEDYFKFNQDFLKKDFRQQDLAHHLGIPKSRLSQIINLLFDQNFNQFINEKRIAVAIQKIQTEEWKNFTIEAIGQEVGFKSRTTFNKAFQEKTGRTPSQFIKQASKD